MRGILFATILHMSGSSFELYRFIYILDDYSIKVSLSKISQIHSQRRKKKERKKEQAGAELGQAQLKLGLGFTSTIDS